MKTFFLELQNRNELLFWFGWINVMGAFACLLLIQTTTTQVLGINAFVKPLKFFLSTVAVTWSMAWYMSYLNQPLPVKIYSWVLILVLSFEVFYITLRAAQGQLSHFNISSAFNGAMFSLMGLAISIFTLWTAYIGYLFFVKDFPDLPLAYVWGIRLGILFFVVFAFEGGMMGAKLSHTIGAPDGGVGLPLTNWSVRAGDLRIAHFIGMHALQLLPLLSYFLVRNVKVVIVISLVYFVVTSLIFIQALFGKPLIKL
jgi:hypothetical protein